MKKIMLFSFIALLLASATFFACSSNKERESKKGPIETVTDKTAKKVAERMLSPIFISTSTYGTRSSTVLLVDMADHATFMEKTYDENGDPVASLEYKLDMESYK